jgi:hypothetical protein
MGTLITAYAPLVRALQLDWQAPTGCPAAAAVLKDVLRLAGAHEGDTLVARAVVIQTPEQRWRVSIDLSGSATGHRTLTADDCAQLARASALIIALAANPEAALDLRGEEPENAVPSTPSTPIDSKIAASRPAPVAVEPALPPSPPEKPAPRRPVLTKPTGDPSASVEMLARAGLESGSLPTSTGWLGVGARVRHPSYPIGAALTSHMTQSTSATFSNGIGARFRVYAAQARLCVEPASRGWHVAGCGGMQLALVRARGYVPTDALSGTGYIGAETFTRYRWIPAPLGAVVLGYEFAPRFVAEFGADLVVPATRWQFVVENVAPVFRAAELQYLLYLGLGIRVN